MHGDLRGRCAGRSRCSGHRRTAFHRGRRTEADYSPVSPRDADQSAISWRDVTPSLVKRLLTCVSIVRLPSTSAAAISLLDLPWAISAATSRSRVERPPWRAATLLSDERRYARGSWAVALRREPWRSD